MHVQVLGPLQVWHSDRLVDLGSSGQRALLGLLALAAGQPVSRAELVDALWGDQVPASATNMIQSRIKHLRRLLEPDRQSYGRSTVLPAVGDGYALRLPAVNFDLTRFRELCAAAAGARRHEDPRRAAALLREALQLFQGAPLADLPALAGHPKLVTVAEQRRLAQTHYGEALLAIGAVAEALPELEAAAADQPLDEALWALLITAYHAAGRRAQAFDAYHKTRRRLAEELGVDPGPKLAAAHDALLHDEEHQVVTAQTDEPLAPVGTGPDTQPALPEPVRRPVPAQLPADVGAFTGRVTQLRRLDGLLPGYGEGTERSVVVVLSGTAGVGKTALAVHWAHRVRAQFPDGQLHANLHGFDPGRSAASPADVAQAFLDALGVPPHHVPTGQQALTGLYRSLLAGRRVLIVLDNARDAEQVRPLLPGSPGCLVMVTSRNRLTSLVAADGAVPLTVDLLSTEEAHELVANRVGRDRAADESGAVNDLVSACARLPLALAIMAARAAVEPGLSLADLAGQLRANQGGLDALSGDDAAIDVRAAFSCSYQALSPPAARLFRLLGLHPGPDFGVSVVAGLAGVAAVVARSLLTELVRAHLVTPYQPDRYAMHDLLRAYAAELVESGEPEAEVRAALYRLFDHYVHTAYAAAAILNPHQDLFPLDATPGVPLDPLTGYDPALAWFTAERESLVAAVEQASAIHFHDHAWRLAWIVEDFLNRRGHWHDWVATQRVALGVGHRLDQPAVRARAHRGLARAYTRLGRFQDAHHHFRQALDGFVELGDDTGQAHTHLGISYATVGEGDHRGALRHAQQALDRYEAAGHRSGQAAALNMIGSYHTRLGDHNQALACCQRALDLYREIGDRQGEADTWDSLGYARHQLGQYREAAECYTQALGLYRDLGVRHYEADTLVKLGENQLAMGERAACRAFWQRALDLLAEIGHTSFVDYDAGEIEAALNRLG